MTAGFSGKGMTGSFDDVPFLPFVPFVSSSPFAGGGISGSGDVEGLIRFASWPFASPFSSDSAFLLWAVVKDGLVLPIITNCRMARLEVGNVQRDGVLVFCTMCRAELDIPSSASEPCAMTAV